MIAFDQLASVYATDAAPIVGEVAPPTFLGQFCSVDEANVYARWENNRSDDSVYYVLT